MKAISVMLLCLSLSIPGYGKKINPDDFTLVVQVTSVSSSRETSSMARHSNTDPACGAIDPQDPRRAHMNCQPSGDTTSVGTKTIFVITAKIGDKIYELAGPRVELGEYHPRFVKSRYKDVELLTTNEKGKLTVIDYKIVGEHSAEKQN